MTKGYACIIGICLLIFNNAYSRQNSELHQNSPNILIFLADDLTWSDTEPYGHEEIKTPNISRLADEGMTFWGMYTSTAMCAPTRQQLYTGMYPVRNGAYPNHSQTYEGVKSLPHYLEPLGYRTGLTGKRHFGPSASFPFQFVGDTGDVSTESNMNAITQFMVQDTSQPFALIIASHQPHKPWDRGDPSAYDVNEITVPPYLVDTPITREQLTEYYAEITYLDYQLGEVLNILDQTGKRKNTLVIFTSEQGANFPFAKWTLYEKGLKTGFIASWPGRVETGSHNYALTQYVDVVPTLLEIAGGNPGSVDTGQADIYGKIGFDGKSFLNLLLHNEPHFREHVYGIHTTLGIIGSEAPYPIRSVSDGRYKLIWNINSESRFSNITNTERDNELIQDWYKASESSPNTLYRTEFYYRRPNIEFYDLEKDPFELTNLAGNSIYNEKIQELYAQLLQWMNQQGDLGLETELQAEQRINRD